MKNYLFLAIAVIAITFSSCKDDDDTDALTSTNWGCHEDDVSCLADCYRNI